MTGTIKNILIFTALGAIFVFIFVFFIKGSPEDEVLTSTVPGEGTASTTSDVADIKTDQDFLPLLLNVQNINLDDSIFSDIAFTRLQDSSIVLTADGTEGRPNPFAPIGSETGATSPSTTP